MNFTRTDLAYEKIEQLHDHSSYKHTKKKFKEITVHTISILTENDILDQEIGEYITVEFDHLNDEQKRQEVSDALCDSLKELIGKLKKKVNKVLIVGLGNQEIIADALGPMVAKECVVTSHLYKLKQKDLIKGTSDVTVITPGVMGQTGLESAEFVEALVKQIKPDCVIAIDALATNSLQRINRVIQMSDTGIHPGAGVGNHRKALNEKTLKIPVISMGVATVVSVEALLHQYLSKIESIDADSILEQANLDEYIKMVVTPKEMDEEIQHLAKVMSDAINYALHTRFSQF